MRNEAPRYLHFIICFGLLGLASSCNILPTQLPSFDPSIFFNKIFDTFLDIVVVLFGFVLLNIFWSRQEEKRKALPHKEYLKTQVKFISGLSQRSLNLLNAIFPAEEPFRVNERNRQIREHIQVLKTISEAIDKVLTNNYEKLDARTSQGFAFFHTYIKPSINLLLEFNQKEIQPYLSEIEAGFSALNQNAVKLRSYLLEITNDLDPSLESRN